MNRIIYIIITVLLFAGCSKDRTEERPSAGERSVVLQLHYADNSKVSTRAELQNADEKQVNNLWTFVFDSSNKLISKQQAVLIAGDPQTATVTLPSNMTGCTLYALANVSGNNVTSFGTFTLGVTTLTTLKAISTDLSSLVAPGLPMSSGAIPAGSISSSLTILLTRSCAKVEVVPGAALQNFTLTNIVGLTNVNTQATIIPDASSPVAGTNIMDVTGITTTYAYVYENAIDDQSDATSVIIRGTYNGYDGYYKLLLKYIDGSSNTTYTIKRNTIYSIRIMSVVAPGYATAAEALANNPQNLSYSVTATDPDSYDLFISNGQYYMGLTNSVCMVYADGLQSNLTVTTLTHNMPSSITAGTITASAGITPVTTSISTSVAKQDIIVNLDSGFTQGTITIRLGNLIKTVTIYKYSAVSYIADVNSNFAAPNYILGEIITTGATWLAMGASASQPVDDMKMSNPLGGIYLFYQLNSATTARRATLYVSDANSYRVKLTIEQQAHP